MTLGVYYILYIHILYYILYYTIILLLLYIIYCTYILLLYILSYTILFASLPLFLSSHIFFRSIFSSSLPLLFHLPSPIPISSIIPFPIFYTSLPDPKAVDTCRHLDILIYVPSVSDNLTPHVLSEWMVEVCAGERLAISRYMMFGLGLCLSGWKGKSVHFRNSGVLLIFLCFSVLELS